MEKERIQEILESKGVIDVTYKNRDVWIEEIGTNMDNKVLVKDLITNKLLEVDIEDLHE